MNAFSNAVRKEERVGDRPAATTDIISVPQACAFLGVHRNTLYKLITEGNLPAFRLTAGGRWKFRKSDLEDWVENRQARTAR